MSTLNTCTSSTRPASPSDGDILYETDTYRTIVYYNSVWQEYLSESSPYDLDGANSLSVRPDAHWDAAKINGTDSSGNPSDGATMVDWVSLIGDYKFLAHGTTSTMPVWEDGASTWGNNLPYVYCTFDFMNLSNSLSPAWDQAFTIWSVGQKASSGSSYGPIGNMDKWDSGYFNHVNGQDFLCYNSSAASGTKIGAPPSGFPITSEAQTWMQERDSSNVNRMHHHGDNTGSAAPTLSSPQAFHNLGWSKWSSSSYGTNLAGVYEIMIFPRNALSTADKNALGSYADSKYSFTTPTTSF